MSLEMLNERKVETVEYDLNLSDEEAKNLKEMGLREIAKDDNACINYAINHALRTMINKLEQDNTLLDKLVKKERKIKKIQKKK